MTSVGASVRCDVCVVGGGPAGTASAIALARAGHDVVLIDKAEFPRDKTCGDGLTTAALRRLENLGLSPDAVCSWQVVENVNIRSTSGRVVEYRLPRGDGQFSVIARRVDLDHALFRLATASGVRPHDATPLIGAVQDPEGISLTTDGLGRVRARFAIGADGQWSRLAKSLGVRKSHAAGEWHAMRQYMSVTGDAARSIWVWFEPDLLPGYVWSFPLPGGQANVGFGMLLDHGRSPASARGVWPRLLARRHIREVLGEYVAVGPPRAWPIPSHIDRAELAAGRALFVGDAAGACDPMTGEGIGQALQTAELAAGAIISAGTEDPAGAAAVYRDSVERTLLRDHRTSTMLARVLSHRRGVSGAVYISGLTERMRRNFVRWMFEDEPRAALVTPGAWRREFLHRPGAFSGPPTAEN